MRALLVALILILLVAGAAAVTRPGPEQFDAMLDKAIRERVANANVENGGAAGFGKGDALDSIALLACKLNTSDCVRLVRLAIDAKIDERVLFTVADVSGFGRDARCYGAFGRFWCGEELGKK